MSNKTLNNPHLKENPFTVPEGYFEQVEARWSSAAVQEKATDKEKGRSFMRLLLPQLQLAAAFALLFGLGYLLMITITKGKTDTLQTEELSILSEWPYWGLDHRKVYDLVLEGLPEDDESHFLLDMDIEDLMDYMNYPGFDPVHLDLNLIYDVRHLP
ncbi:MAG: hypothetical protein GX877_06960 [Bacteroidales bacterium]|nr:hypothetical protein [Bacteroidales bacterium]